MKKWVYLNILFLYVPLIVVFYLYVYIFIGICLKLFFPVSFCMALWDIYYMHLAWEDIKNDFSRITDSLQIYFLNFINVLATVFLWRHLIHLMKQKVKKSDPKLHFIP